MLLFTYYLLKVTLVSGLLYGYYLVALRNKKFHQYNRFYLLLAVLLSLIIPLIKINFLNYGIKRPNIITFLSAINNADVYVKTATVKPYFLSDYKLVALFVFLVITGAALFFFISKILKIFLIIRNNPKKAWNNVCFVFTESSEAPFSFFKYIFWNDNIKMDSEQGNYILRHELTHVQQLHSADKLLLNIVLIAGWANPFFWIIRKELNLLHEFIADQKAITNGDTNAFATMLLTATYTQHSFALTHSFFHSPIKRRLLMITEAKTASYSYLRRLMILPLLAFISVFSAFKLETQTFGKEDKKLVQSKYIGETKKDLSEENKSDTIEAKFPGGDQAWKKYLEKNLDANVPVVKDKAPKGMYTVKVQFIVTENGELHHVSAIQVPSGCPSCAIEAVGLIKKGPKWEPMTIDGKNVTSQRVQFISFMVE